MTRCTMLVKKMGGHIRSSLHKIIGMLFSSWFKSSNVNVFEHMPLKNADNSISGLTILFGKDPSNTIGSGYCISMWLS
jgi:hypothetical protein